MFSVTNFHLKKLCDYIQNRGFSLHFERYMEKLFYGWISLTNNNWEAER